MTTPTARDLVALYDQRIAMTKAMANHPRPTGAMAQAVMDKGAELDEACEKFRRANYPRRHRVIVGLREVWAVSRTGRSSDLIFDGNETTAENCHRCGLPESALIHHATANGHDFNAPYVDPEPRA